MYASAWPGLNPFLLLGPQSRHSLPFPFNAPHRTYSYVARNLIYQLFAALGMKSQEVVLVPDYHHGVEVRAMRAAGARLRFYPIRRNLQPELEEVERLARAGARVLVTIHYLGWPQPVEELAALCRRHGMILLEDCALSLLSEVDGRPLGSFGDYAVFCLYKTVPVPDGALLVQNRDVGPKLMGLDAHPCGGLSVAGRTSELLLCWLRTHCRGRGKVLFTLKRAAGRILTSAGIQREPVGDIGFDPSRVGTEMSWLARKLLHRFDYEQIRQKRRENFRLLRDRLAGRAALGVEDLSPGVCPLFFPLLVADKAGAAQALHEQGIEAVQFWNAGDPEARGNPEVEFLRGHVLELPIHQDLTPEHLEYMARCVLRLQPGCLQSGTRIPL